MPRHTREKILRVRFRKPDRSIKSVLVVNSNHKSAKSGLDGNRVLRVGKVRQEELDKTGEFFPAEQLLKDIKKDTTQPTLDRVPQHGF